MKRLPLLLLAAVALGVSVSAQVEAGIKNQRGPKPQSSMFVELGGQGLLLTFNGDFRLSAAKNNMGLRAGIGFISEDEDAIVTIPLGINFLFGKGGKYFETGLGITFLSGNQVDVDGEARSFGTMFFGYRSQPPDGGFNFRAGITAVFHTGGKNQDSFFLPYLPGVSFGYTFEQDQ